MSIRRHLVMVLLSGVVGGGCANAFSFEPTASAVCGAPAWCVTGVVLADSSGGPIPGAQVLVTGSPCGAVADSAGHFTLTCTGAPGDTLVVRGLGYETLRRRVAVTPGQPYRARIRLTAVPPRVPSRPSAAPHEGAKPGEGGR